ncbi:transcription initiation factor IID, 18kD subunit-domain-containing protein [Kickxella alabastrina]|uniref:transcription initiation factor IID, 18kD subunit-domain-containing protein n=1 Tax=Kickxella alabastrina TaxID=61397 RepID=UPI00221EB706|nr:transcription initiation factor IID, 18kD subunit-domain-containing protein [Kickxella alabastrina]KAI7833395.1 transcription initiation factor IID, 18kD subunit-domain-containing protein [Kickxella alabastrina]
MDPHRDRPTKYRYTTEIQQMMFVFGEVQDPLPETTMLIEDIVRSQVIEIIVMAAAQAQRRGSRFMAAEDFIFLIRHDRTKVMRLREYLSWKDVRKKVKEREDADNDVIDDAAADKPDRGASKVKIRLSWELATTFLDNINDDDNDNDNEDEEMLDAQSDSLKRLKDADDVTKQMTRDEYVHYSECRQASFTFRKGKRFREWANMAAYLDTKLNDEIIDILGFLTFEMVSKITESALKIKRDLEKAANDAQCLVESMPTPTPTPTCSQQQPQKLPPKLATSTVSLFSGPPTARTPLDVQHVQEAFRRLQRAPQPIRNFKGGLTRTRVSFI